MGVRVSETTSEIRIATAKQIGFTLISLTLSLIAVLIPLLFKGSSEIGFTVVSISFSLVAAFIPLLFMGGVVGRLFKEFALTATSTIVISVLVSLTLAPTLAALFMRAPAHHADAKPGFGERLLALYDTGLKRALAHQRLMLGVFGVTLAMAIAGCVLIP